MEYLLGHLSSKTLMYNVLSICYLKGKHRAWDSRVGATFREVPITSSAGFTVNSINPSRRHEKGHVSIYSSMWVLSECTSSVCG
jgi:hypothetical protein